MHRFIEHRKLVMRLRGRIRGRMKRYHFGAKPGEQQPLLPIFIILGTRAVKLVPVQPGLAFEPRLIFLRSNEILKASIGLPSDDTQPNDCTEEGCSAWVNLQAADGKEADYIGDEKGNASSKDAP